MSSKGEPAIYLLYVIAAVISFGHASANCTYSYSAKYRFDGFEQIAGAKCKTDDAAINGFFAAVLWPLYWSWEAFDGGAA